MQKISHNNRFYADSHLTFLHGFLKQPHKVGSIIPSSRFLERRIINLSDIKYAQVVVELGAGTGGTTRAILDSLPKNAKLLSIEIHPDFLPLLKAIKDPRLIVYNGDALNLQSILNSLEMATPDIIISGIPFSTMSRQEGYKVLEIINNVLCTQGKFVAYQFRDRVAILARKFFGKPKVEFELLNIPPMRVYRWEKNSTL